MMRVKCIETGPWPSGIGGTGTIPLTRGWPCGLRMPIVVLLIVFARPMQATTYYVRTDGGSASQCTGLADAPYPGTGTGQPCAWDHPFRALPPGGPARIAGGDTLIIGTGSYRMGYAAPESSSCSQSYPWDCTMGRIPSGPGPGSRTRVLGAGWDVGCPTPPELWGTERAAQVIDLTGSSNVEVACLEITDHAGCVEFHSGGLACKRDEYPFGDWAPTGIVAADSANVVLADLNIHGFASAGIRAGRLTGWTVRDVRVAGNGWVGWDGDITGNDSNSGTLLFQRWTVEWNGCGETWPGGQPTGCWGQSAGGYGDGVGTGETQGTWIIEDSAFRHNTSDGLDLLYARPGASITIRRTIAEGNAGNQIKTNGPATIENAIVVGNCGFFDGKPFTYNVDPCRALGNVLSLGLWNGAEVTLVNSTVTGEGDCLVLAGCDGTASGAEEVTLRNNIFVGQTDFLQPWENTCLTYADKCPGEPFDTDYSVIVNVKGGPCPGANDICTSTAGLYDEGIDTFDAHLMASSPAVDSGLPVGGIVPGEDFDAAARPVGLGVDRGAFERDATLPAPTRTPTPTGTVTATPTLTATPAPTVDPEQRKCGKQVRKQLLSLFRLRLRILQDCYARVNRGETSPPCPDARATAAVQKAQQRLDAARLARHCASSIIPEMRLGGVCAGATDATELANCITTATARAADRLLPVEHAVPDAVLANAEERTCQAAIAHGAGIVYATFRAAASFTCANQRDQGSVGGCPDARATARQEGAHERSERLILAACRDDLITALQSRGGFGGTCASADTVAELVACEVAEHDLRTDDLLAVLP